MFNFFKKKKGDGEEEPWQAQINDTDVGGDFYYNKELKAWVHRGKEEEMRAKLAQATAPPPTAAQVAQNAQPAQQEEDDPMAAFLRPPSRTMHRTPPGKKLSMPGLLTPIPQVVPTTMPVMPNVPGILDIPIQENIHTSALVVESNVIESAPAENTPAADTVEPARTPETLPVTNTVESVGIGETIRIANTHVTQTVPIAKTHVPETTLEISIPELGAPITPSVPQKPPLVDATNMSGSLRMRSTNAPSQIPLVEAAVAEEILPIGTNVATAESAAPVAVTIAQSNLSVVETVPANDIPVIETVPVSDIRTVGSKDNVLAPITIAEASPEPEIPGPVLNQPASPMDIFDSKPCAEKPEFKLNAEVVQPKHDAEFLEPKHNAGPLKPRDDIEAAGLKECAKTHPTDCSSENTECKSVARVSSLDLDYEITPGNLEERIASLGDVISPLEPDGRIGSLNLDSGSKSGDLDSGRKSITVSSGAVTPALDSDGMIQSNRTSLMPGETGLTSCDEESQVGRREEVPEELLEQKVRELMGTFHAARSSVAQEKIANLPLPSDRHANNLSFHQSAGFSQSSVSGQGTSLQSTSLQSPRAGSSNGNGSLRDPSPVKDPVLEKIARDRRNGVELLARFDAAQKELDQVILCSNPLLDSEYDARLTKEYLGEDLDEDMDATISNLEDEELSNRTLSVTRDVSEWNFDEDDPMLMENSEDVFDLQRALRFACSKIAIQSQQNLEKDFMIKAMRQGFTQENLDLQKKNQDLEDQVALLRAQLDDEKKENARLIMENCAMMKENKRSEQNSDNSNFHQSNENNLASPHSKQLSAKKMGMLDQWGMPLSPEARQVLGDRQNKTQTRRCS